MAERVKIDDTYTYVFDEGKVYLLRHGVPWLGGPGGFPDFPGSQAWIADLRAEVERLEDRLIEATSP